jgi:hypothetical protein
MEYETILFDKIKIMIRNDLTIGRTDNALEPYTQDGIDEFIFDNYQKIDHAIKAIIYDYTNDDELESLKDPPFQWIGEYLYQFIDVPIDT